ncbi:MAG: 2-phospho-L-lactate guanylyltransferase [Actinomycetota bacterium]|nr:2-phospho-L-lactate guanylyltransferase [Actinomycetota bacterium]
MRTISPQPDVSSPQWRAVVCARPLSVAKSRLRPLGEGVRQALALAMTQDVLEAAAGAPSVTEVVLVSDDPLLSQSACALGALVLPDPGLGLNGAFLHGMDNGSAGHTWTALLVADLPCLTSRALQRVLVTAARHDTAVVADRRGTGTTLLTTAPGRLARPRFGDASFNRHVANGAEPVAAHEQHARCDVDTPADLGVALRIGVGPHTVEAVEDSGLDRVGSNTQLYRSTR